MTGLLRASLYNTLPFGVCLHQFPALTYSLVAIATLDKTALNMLWLKQEKTTEYPQELTKDRP